MVELPSYNFVVQERDLWGFDGFLTHFVGCSAADWVPAMAELSGLNSVVRDLYQKNLTLFFSL